MAWYKADAFLTPDAVANLARNLFGEPNRRLSTSRDLRFGRRGSLAVCLERGVFHDHESGVSGGIFDLVVYAGAARDRREAARLLEAGGTLPRREPPEDFALRRSAEREARADRITTARAIWKAGRPIIGSPAETYLREARGISAPLGAAWLRFSPDVPHSPYRRDTRGLPAMVAAVVDGRGKFTGAHLTYLRPDGSAKADVQPSRKMVGIVGGGHVPLIPGKRLVVAEGIESAVSAWEAAAAAEGVSMDSLGALAALSASGVANLDWPDATTALIIAPDNDANGAGQRGGLELARRASGRGLSVGFLTPPDGCSDWNDVRRTGGDA